MANIDNSFRVNGPAIVQAGVGSSNALVTTAISEGGVNIQILQHSRPIFNDVGGSEVPAEYQYMGEQAVIELEAPNWVETYARLLRTRCFLANGSTRQTDGLAGGRGQLWGTHGLAFSIAILAGNFGEDPWYFPTCMVPPSSMGLMLGTTNSKHKFRFLAWPFISGSSITAVDKVCWARTIP